MPALTLDQTPLRERHVVAAVQAPASASEQPRWLEEIGFIPGKPVMLMARGALGGDPLVVRVGQSTFALRRAEAANCDGVTVEPKEGKLVTPAGKAPRMLDLGGRWRDRGGARSRSCSSPSASTGGSALRWCTDLPSGALDGCLMGV